MSVTLIRRIRLTLFTLLVMMESGCATIPPNDLLGFLWDGVTTREEVLLRLGQPSCSLQQKDILTYRLAGEPGRGLTLVPRQPDMLGWYNVNYSLVLVFDRRGRLQRQNLVAIQ